MKEWINDSSSDLTVNAYYGTGEISNIRDYTKKLDTRISADITVTEIEGAHSTKENGIVQEFYRNYAYGRQNVENDTESSE